MKKRAIFWPEFTFGPVHLWTMPKLTHVDYKVKKVKDRVVHSTAILPNEFYNKRREH